MMVQVVDVVFCHCVNVLEGAEFQASGCFFEFFDQTKLKNQKIGLHADISFSRN